MDYALQSSELLTKIEDHIEKVGEATATSMQSAVELLLEWLGHLHAHERTGTGDEFLDGVRSLTLEAVGGASVGLYRSCILSMRGQIDALFSWLYFKDHRVELERVLRENEGYRLKRESFEYLADYYPRFSIRFDILKAARTRTSADPYKALSAHVHSMGYDTIPKLNSLADMIADHGTAAECVDVQKDVVEYLNDILLACFAGKWASLPDPIMAAAKARLTPEKIALIVAA
jgi:hypothetical protein